jgi:hypothetical protein
MNGRKAAVLAASLATLMTFAGCLAPSELLKPDSSKTEITALESKDLADGAAKAWDPQAKIVGVFGLELSDATAADQWPTDPSVGNGKSPAWVYVYAGEAGKSVRAFRVSADGRVAAENDSYDAQSAAEQAKPLGEWTIDSDRAVEVAKGNEVFAQAIGGENGTVAMGVAHMEGITGWYLAAMSGAGSAFAIVNAATGDLVTAETFNANFMPPAMGKEVFDEARPTHAEGQGTVDSSKEKAEFPFTHGGSKEVVLKLDAQGRLPTDDLAWKIVDAAGDSVKTGYVSGQSGVDGPGRSHWVIEMPDAGDYTLVLAYRGTPTPFPLGGVDFKFTLDSAKPDADEAPSQ